MAVDKLVDSTQLDADLTSVADAIRTKGGTSAQLAFPADFVQAIDAIETGGGGDYVAIDWLQMSKPTGAITLESGGDQPPAYCLYGRTGITEINLPNATRLQKNGLNGVKGNPRLNAPNVTILLTGAVGESNFTYLVLPMCRDVNANGGMHSLLGIDFGGIGGSTGFSAYAFQNCDKLATIILRGDGVFKLGALNAITNTPFASGKAGGTLYVPSAQIANYQAAANWSTILGYANNQILPIEGSIYETQYVDGTPIPTT